MPVVVGNAPDESLGAVGEVHNPDILPLVEKCQSCHVMVSEGTVVVQRTFPVERRIIVVLHDSGRNSIGILFVYIIAECGEDPRIPFPGIVGIPVNIVHGIGTGGLLRDPGMIGAQRYVNFGT